MIITQHALAEVQPYPSTFKTETLAKALMADHAVIVPDLRGMGLSSRPVDRLYFRLLTDRQDRCRYCERTDSLQSGESQKSIG
jgi:pimeloyl-ACP methyl ester carboxylesterase